MLHSMGLRLVRVYIGFMRVQRTRNGALYFGEDIQIVQQRCEEVKGMDASASQ